MKTLVIGANGNLGREVLDQLAGQMEVKAGVRNPENMKTTSNLEVVKFDYDQPETFEAALNGVDQVFVQAPPLDATAPQRMSAFIDDLKKRNILRVVFISALGVDQNEEAPLRKVERIFMNGGFAYTFIRPNFYIENFTSGFAADGIKYDQTIVANTGDAKLSFVSIRDIAAVVSKVIRDDSYVGKGLNVTGSQAVSHQEVADFFSQKMDQKVSYIALSAEEMKAGAMEHGLSEGNADYLVHLYEIAKAGFLAGITPDIENVLGRSPLTFETAI